MQLSESAGQPADQPAGQESDLQHLQAVRKHSRAGFDGATNAKIKAGRWSRKPLVKQCTFESKVVKSLTGPEGRRARQWAWARQKVLGSRMAAVAPAVLLRPPR